MFTYDSGEECKELCSHSNEISVLKVDYTNQLYISAGWDSKVIIQKEGKKEFELKRCIENLFYNKEIMIMEVSVYHNLIVTGSNTNNIYLWDYEYCRLLACVELESEADPVSICFINGFSLILIGTNKNKIYILHFETHEQNIDFNIIGFINLSNITVLEGLEEDTTEVMNHANSLKQKISKADTRIFPNKILIDMTYNSDVENSKPEECGLYLGLTSGFIRFYDLMDLFKRKELFVIPHSNKRLNYNPFRSNKESEDFISSIKKLKLNSYQISEEFYSGSVKLNFQGHKESLTTMSLINLNDKKLLTASTDCYVKIWNMSGFLLASVNINHPLPIKWMINVDKMKRKRKNILFALKIIELIFRRYKKTILLSEEKLISLNNFLSSLVKESAGGIASSKRSSLNELRDLKKVVVMRDEYEPRDLQFHKVKGIYQRELVGPSLKEMEANKRVLIAQRQWKSSQNNDGDDITNFQAMKYEEQLFKEKDPLAFFEPDYRERLLNRMGDDEFSESVQKFGKKLDNHIKKKKGMPTTTFGQDQIHQKRLLEKYDKKPKTMIKSTDLHSDRGDSDREGVNDLKAKGKKVRIEASTLDESKNKSKITLKSRSNEINFYDYAGKKQLLDSLSLTKSIDNSKLTNSILEERQQFHTILKNLDAKLKKSMNSYSNMSNFGEMVVSSYNLLDENHPFNKKLISLPKIKDEKSINQKPREYKRTSSIIRHHFQEKEKQMGNKMDEMMKRIQMECQKKAKKFVEKKMMENEKNEEETKISLN